MAVGESFAITSFRPVTAPAPRPEPPTQPSLPAASGAGAAGAVVTAAPRPGIDLALFPEAGRGGTADQPDLSPALNRAISAFRSGGGAPAAGSTADLSA